MLSVEPAKSADAYKLFDAFQLFLAQQNIHAFIAKIEDNSK